MRSVLRTLGWAVLLNCTQLAFTSDSLLPHPVATLDTSELLPSQRDLTFTDQSGKYSIRVSPSSGVRRAKSDSSSGPSRLAGVTSRLHSPCSAPVLRLPRGRTTNLVRVESVLIDLQSADLGIQG
jgi:hypothetical protein